MMRIDKEILHDAASVTAGERLIIEVLLDIRAKTEPSVMNAPYFEAVPDKPKVKRNER